MFAVWMYVVCNCMYTHVYVVDICMWHVNVYTHTCVSGRFCMYVVWMYVVCKCIYGHIYVRYECMWCVNVCIHICTW